MNQDKCTSSVWNNGLYLPFYLWGFCIVSIVPLLAIHAWHLQFQFKGLPVTFIISGPCFSFTLNCTCCDFFSEIILNYGARFLYLKMHYLITVAPVKGCDISGSVWTANLIWFVESRKMSRLKNLSNFDKVQVVKAGCVSFITPGTSVLYMEPATCPKHKRLKSFFLIWILDQILLHPLDLWLIFSAFMCNLYCGRYTKARSWIDWWTDSTGLLNAVC